MPKKKSETKLTRRDYSILRDAAQFGLVVPEFLRAYRFADRQPAAVTSTLRRLYGEPPAYRYLRPEPLDAERAYYRLTVRGCQRLGVSRDLAKRLGKKALAERYATQWFVCADRPGARKLFDPGQFPEQFDQIPKRLPKRRFYFEQTEDQTMCLGYFLVDLRSDVRRIVRRSCHLMSGFIAQGVFNDYLAHGRFTFTALTFNQEKGRDLEQSLRTEFARQLTKPLMAIGVAPNEAGHLPIQVRQVPGLDTLIPN